MVDQKIEQEIPEGVNTVENALIALWEKAREASCLITTLREDKKKMLQQIDDLEEELTQTKNEFIVKQTQLEQIRQEIAEHTVARTNGRVTLDEEEKRMLQQKLKSVVAKLDQYLSP